MDGGRGEFERITRDFEYTQLRYINSPNIILDDESWRNLRRWRDQFQRMLAGPLGANPNDARNIRKEISALDDLETTMRERLAHVSIDAVNHAVAEVNRVQGAMDVLTRIPEFVDTVNNARSIHPQPDDSTDVPETLDAFFMRLDACTKGVLTLPAARAAHAMMHNIRAYLCIFDGAEHSIPTHKPLAPLSGLVVLADPMPRAQAHNLMATLGAWVCTDPTRLRGEKMFTHPPASSEDMLRALATLSPKCFNLLREQLAANKTADAWISEIGIYLSPGELLIVLAYLFPQQLFAQHAGIVQRQMAIHGILLEKIARDLRVHDNRSEGYIKVCNMMYQIAFPLVHRWADAREKTISTSGEYRRVMMKMWTPELDMSPDYFEWSSAWNFYVYTDA